MSHTAGTLRPVAVAHHMDIVKLVAPLNKKITFCTYNSYNYDAVKYDFAKEMFSKCDFLLLQETWKRENEFITNFKKDFPESECIAASQMDLDGIKAGRPYGGVAICYHGSLKCKIVKIP